MNNRLQSAVFSGTSRLTDMFPEFGGHLLDSVIRPTYGSRTLSALFERDNRRVMKSVKTLRRFLVIPDIHIGDSVMMQSSLSALRDFFPDAEIDYVINRTAAPLIEGNPEATRVIPLYANGLFPSPAEIGTLKGLLRTGQYDLCVNICPFLEKREIAVRSQPVARFLNHAPTLIRNEDDTRTVNHFSYQAYRFVRDILSTVAQPVRGDHFTGVRTTYADEAVEGALQFARQCSLSPRARVIMFNPDSSVKYNLMPFESQVKFLELLARNTGDDVTILIGEGHTEAGIGIRLAETVSPSTRAKVRIIPRSMPLDTFAALIDFAEVFISGDTGPLHIAASRRYSRSGRYKFRNGTAVLSVFGATPPRMSGYDSFQEGYLPSNQDAPAWCYLAGSPCRNITCLNKMFKTCGKVRCFEHMDLEGLGTLISSYLRGPAMRDPPGPGRFMEGA